MQQVWTCLAKKKGVGYSMEIITSRTAVVAPKCIADDQCCIEPMTFSIASWQLHLDNQCAISWASEHEQEKGGGLPVPILDPPLPLQLIVENMTPVTSEYALYAQKNI